MPSGSPSFDLSPIPAGIAINAAPVGVARYNPTDGSNPYTILPNVWCLRIDYREGAEPAVARFQYAADDAYAATAGWPNQFEQIWPINAQGTYIVQNDDRLVVLTQTPSGDPKVLFDGFAQVPQVDLNAQTQAITFVAVHVAARLWDKPLTGRVERDASHSTDTTGNYDRLVDLPSRFNPSDTSVGAIGGYIGNAVGDAYDTEPETGPEYSVFIDPLVIERESEESSYWYVSDAIGYLLSIMTNPDYAALIQNPVDTAGNPYVNLPSVDSLETLLACYAPPPGGVLNSSTAVESNVQIRDYDASNKTVPEILAELLSYCGFILVYQQDTDTNGLPKTSLKFLRKDALATAAPKVLYLAPVGGSLLGPDPSNVTALHLARDSNGLVNQWNVETSLKQYEISILLAPGFTPSSGDAADRTPFFLTNLTSVSSTQRRKYRWWVADEAGDGHYDMTSSSWVTDTPPDFTNIFPNDENDNRTYCDRYRPGSNTLITVDPATGKPLKALLQVKVGTTSGAPALSTDATATGWITVKHGWKLLEDRLGIEVTVNDPDEWTTGAITKDISDSSAAVAKINAVSATATPGSDYPPFQLKLTTVIEADRRLPIQSVARPASPTRFARERSADGKDHFQYCEVSQSSWYINNYGSGPPVVRDDTKAAQTHADQLRSAHEFPTLAGSATIPFITDYYQIGDRVSVIQGRNASLQINVGANTGETPCYPWVTAFAWEFSGNKQQTIIQFSDRRAEPQGV